MSGLPVLLDHVVLYARYDLPALSRQFENLGFQLTPLGRHSTGSINRLAILDGAYIELIGFEAGASPEARPELQRQDAGLNALAFRSVPTGQGPPYDAEHFNPTVGMERPVTSGAESGVARFRITTLKQPVKDFRVFLCDHLTPEWIWRSEWQAHPNTAHRVARIRIGTQEPDRLRSSLRLVMNLPPDHVGTMSCGSHSIDVVPATAAGSRLSLLVHDIEATKKALRAAGITWRREEDESVHLVVALPAPASCEIAFIEQPSAPGP